MDIICSEGREMDSYGCMFCDMKCDKNVVIDNMNKLYTFKLEDSVKSGLYFCRQYDKELRHSALIGYVSGTLESMFKVKLPTYTEIMEDKNDESPSS